MKVINIDLKNYFINVEIEGEVKRFSLLNAGVNYAKMFYLGYYENPVYVNVDTLEINKDFFMI
jgi:hypothetical protein